MDWNRIFHLERQHLKGRLSTAIVTGLLLLFFLVVGGNSIMITVMGILSLGNFAICLFIFLRDKRIEENTQKES